VVRKGGLDPSGFTRQIKFDRECTPFGLEHAATIAINRLLH